MVFAFVTVAPFVKSFGQSIGIDASPTSALAAGLVMGVMIILSFLLYLMM